MKIALWLVAVILFALMPSLWQDKSGGETYALDSRVFNTQQAEMLSRYATGEDEDGIPVVAPPNGDVYLTAQRWHWYPVLELKVGQKYRLHVTTEDVQHGFHLRIGQIDRILEVGKVRVIEIIPENSGRFLLACSDYCGIGHNKMTSFVRVKQ